MQLKGTPTETSRKRKRKVLGYLITIAISGGLLYFALSRFDTKQIWGTISKANWVWLSASAANSILVNIILASWQWQVLLARMGLPLSLGENIRMKCALYPMRLMFPSKSGDLLRALYMKNKFGFSAATVVTATFLVVGGNLGVLLLISFVSAMIGMGPDQIITKISGAGTIICLTVFFLLRRLSRNKEGIPELITRLGAPLQLPLGTITAVVFIGMVGLLIHLFTFYAIIRALDLPIPLTAALTATPLVFIAGNLPGTWIGIGTREISVVAFFSSYAAPEALMAAGLLLTVIDKLISVVVGIPFFPGFIKTAFSADRSAALTTDPSVKK